MFWEGRNTKELQKRGETNNQVNLLETNLEKHAKVCGLVYLYLTSHISIEATCT